MKIAFLVYRFPTLSETFILNQITGLIDQGHSVDIYAQRAGDTELLHPQVEKYNLLEKTHYLKGLANPAPTVKEPGTISTLRLFLSALPFALKNPKPFLSIKDFWKDKFQLMCLIKCLPKLPELSTSYDIIHCHFAHMGSTAILFRHLKSPTSKVVTTFHGYDVNYIDRQKIRKKYGTLFEHGDLYTSNTNFTANQAVSLGCSKEKIHILPVGLEISKYNFRETHFPEDGEIKIITVARLVEKKGIEYSIQAVAKALKNYPDIEYRIVGDGMLRESLEDLANDLGVTSQIKFLGWKSQDEIIKLYQESHLFILSSVTAANGDKEGQGLVLQEAQAIGLPVLSTLHNGIPDGVLDGESGFLVPEKDVNALYEKITHLIENSSIWPKMSHAGRRHVEANYDIEDLNKRLEKIYGKAIKSTSN